MKLCVHGLFNVTGNTSQSGKVQRSMTIEKT
jgi:hypothetical protein